jgi:hypothetical protein
MKTLNGKESLLMWSVSVCHNTLDPAVNFRMTSTVGQFVLSFHCVKYVSVVSPVSMSVSLSLWAECLHLLISLHQSLILISFPWCLSCKVSYGSQIAKCTLTELQHTPNPTLSDWSCVKHLHCMACRVLLLWHGTDSCVELKINIRTNPHFKRVRKKTYSWRKEICLWCHIVLNIEKTSLCIPFLSHWLHMNLFATTPR